MFRIKYRRHLAAIFAGALAIVLGIRAYVSTLGPVLPVPVPADFAQLDSLLKSHLMACIRPLRDSPRDSHLREELALAYAANGFWSEAQLLFDQLSILDPQDPLPLLYSGVAREELHDPAASLVLYRRVTEMFPQFAPGWSRLGTAALEADSFDVAQSAFARLTSLAPQEWRGPAGAGELELRRGKPGEAIPLLERAVQLNPDSRTAHHLLGRSYLSMGRTNEASLQLALGRNVEGHPMPDAWTDRALAHIKSRADVLRLAKDALDEGDPATAARYYEEIRVHHPNEPELLNQLAIAYNRLNQPAKAIDLVERVLKTDPRHVAAQITAAYANSTLGRYTEALAHVDAAVQITPDLALAHLARANAFLGLNRDLEAVAALESAHRADPGNAQLLVELGTILWRNLDRPDAALERLESARKLDPALAPIYPRITALYLQLGRTADALATVEIWKLVRPKDPEIPAALARIQSSRGTQFPHSIPSP